MNMKDHLLAALQEQFSAWDALLATIPETHISRANASAWAVKDVIAHLWAWQQITTARVEAAVEGQTPEYPVWVAGLGPDWEANPDQMNAWVSLHYHDQPWETVYKLWAEGFARLLQVARHLPEPELLAWHRYAWMDGPPLAVLLLATYDHHQEHLDKLRAWIGR